MGGSGAGPVVGGQGGVASSGGGPAGGFGGEGWGGGGGDLPGGAGAAGGAGGALSAGGMGGEGGGGGQTTGCTSGGEPQWGAVYGDSSQDVGWGLAGTSSSDIIWAGDLGGPGTARFDAAGNVLWTTPFSSNFATCVGAGDATLVVGPGGIKRLDDDGAVLWSKNVSLDRGYGCAYDGLDDSFVLVLRSALGTLDLGLGPVQGKLVVARLAPDGTTLWNYGYSTAGVFYDDGGVAVDGSGNIFVAGGFSQTIELGAGPVSSQGSASDIYVAKFDASGALTWSNFFQGPGYDRATGAAATSDGGVIFVGRFEGSMDFGGGSISGDAYITKLDSFGNQVFANQFGDAQFQTFNGVAVGPTDEFAVVGTFKGEIDMGCGVLVDSGNTIDIFAAKFAGDGSNLWSRAVHGTSQEEARALALLQDGSVVAAGFTLGTLTFASETFPNAGSADAFLLVFGP